MMKPYLNIGDHSGGALKDWAEEQIEADTTALIGDRADTQSNFLRGRIDALKEILSMFDPTLLRIDDADEG